MTASLGTAWTGDRQTFPQWLEAISTAVGLGAAVFAARYAANAWALEVSRDAQKNRQEPRRQAELVAAWVSPVTVQYWSGDTAVINELTETIRSASVLPVTNAKVVFTVRTVKGPDQRYSDVAELDRVVVPPDDVTANEPVSAVVQLRTQQAIDSGLQVSEVTVLAGIAFTDAAGCDWIREPSGRLTAAPDPLVRRRSQQRIF